MGTLDVPNGDVIAAFHHTLTGWSKSLVCTIGIGVDEAEPLDENSANDVFGWWSNEMKTSVTASLSFTGVILYWKQPLGYVPIPSNDSPVAGTGSGSPLPPNCAAMIQKNTGRPGRAGRGRMFLPGISEALVSGGGVVDGALVTQMNGDLASFYTAVTTSGQFDDLLLYHDDDIPSSSPTLIDSLTVNVRTSSISKRFRRS